jgi:hypothetical protein
VIDPYRHYDSEGQLLYVGISPSTVHPRWLRNE